MLGIWLERLWAAADRHLPQHLRSGRRGERLAYRYLCGQGYRIVARNYRPKRGHVEVDLIGWDGEWLAFIEVKSRRNEDFGSPERAVDGAKRVHVIRAALDYARRARVDTARIRFDVVGILLREPPRIELYKGAFSARRERARAARKRAVMGSRRSGPVGGRPGAGAAGASG